MLITLFINLLAWSLDACSLCDTSGTVYCTDQNWCNQLCQKSACASNIMLKTGKQQKAFAMQAKAFLAANKLAASCPSLAFLETWNIKDG